MFGNVSIHHRRRYLGLGIVAAAAFAFATASYASSFKVSSHDVGPHKHLATRFVFKGFGCKGGNVSPQLQWRGAPAGTKSFAVSLYDPDAPTGSGWWHWYVVNLPASTTHLARNAGKPDGANLPVGAMQINTDFGAPGYGGPCPPPGDKPHRYVLTVYALKVAKLNIPPHATAALAGFMVNGNAIAKARLTFRYGR